MPRIRRYAVLVAIAALVPAACADASTVATVNESTIEESAVASLRQSYQDTDQLDADAYRSDLTSIIYIEAEKDAAAEDFGLTDLDDPDRIAAKVDDPGPVDVAIMEAQAADPDRTEEWLALVAEQLIIREDVTTALLSDDEDFLTDIFENQPETLAQVCARHILTATDGEAAAARTRVAAGEDFAAVADEVSLDAGSPGGELPCPTSAAAFVSPFGGIVATAPVGELSEPFESQFGWHIVVVDARDAPESVADLIADPTAYVGAESAGALWSSWAAGAVGESDIEVRSQVGAWSGEAGTILPPPAG